MRRVALTNCLSLVCSCLVLCTTACSIRSLAINSLADSLASSGDVFASDEDPELIRDAAPFALKTMESLLAEAPDHQNLLLAACRGFTQYAFAFLQTDAYLIEPDDYPRSVELRERALKMYIRARDYGLRGLESHYPGISKALRTDPGPAAARIDLKHLPLLFWTGAAWGSAISLGKDRPDLVADVAAIRALMRRALSLDEGYEAGSIHDVMIDIESLPALMGGSQDKARAHFDRAVKLSHGLTASPYVSFALNVSVPNQDREEFEELLHRALEIDPDADPGNRLVNLIMQKKARALLARSEDLFVE